jgi:hypothetical protein
MMNIHSFPSIDMTAAAVDPRRYALSFSGLFSMGKRGTNQYASAEIRHICYMLPVLDVISLHGQCCNSQEHNLATQTQCSQPRLLTQHFQTALWAAAQVTEVSTIM